MGIVGSFLSEMYPAKATWSVNDIPDLTGKVVIVTGGSTGAYTCFIAALHLAHLRTP